MRYLMICLALLGFMSVGIQCDNNIIQPEAGTSLVQDEGAAAVCLPGEVVVFNTDTKVPFAASDVTDFHHQCWLRSQTKPAILSTFEAQPESWFFCGDDSFMVGTGSQFIPPKTIWTEYVRCRG